MVTLTWIPSDWLTPPDRSESSPFYPWPEDWLGRNGASEPELSLDRVELVEHFRLKLFEDPFRFGHTCGPWWSRNPNEKDSEISPRRPKAPNAAGTLGAIHAFGCYRWMHAVSLGTPPTLCCTGVLCKPLGRVASSSRFGTSCRWW